MLQIGPIAVHAFGVSVMVAVWVGLALGQRQFARLGLDPILGQRLAGWVLVGGLLGAHVFAVVFYVPRKLARDPWLILRVWEDISSFGSILGGLAAALLFFALRETDQDRRSVLAYLDAIAFVFPMSLAIGRFGCVLAHDHPGVVTSFPLGFSLRSDSAMSFIAGIYRAAGLVLPAQAKSMGFHDLGLYEFLFLSIVVVPLFLRWNGTRRPTGFYLAAFAALYLPVRFGLDMLRVGDARYAGFTPAQWVAASVIAALPLATVRRRRVRFAICGAVILLAGCARHAAMS